MDTFERNAARTLAIAYHAYMNAGPDNWQPWAKLLIQAQRDSGVELLPVSSLLYGQQHDAESAADVAPAPVIEPSRGVLRSQSGMIEGDDSGDGGALVPAPKPAPRKPSPGASIAAQAAKFYAAR